MVRVFLPTLWGGHFFIPLCIAVSIATVVCCAIGSFLNYFNFDGIWQYSFHLSWISWITFCTVCYCTKKSEALPGCFASCIVYLIFWFFGPANLPPYSQNPEIQSMCNKVRITPVGQFIYITMVVRNCTTTDLTVNYDFCCETSMCKHMDQSNRTMAHLWNVTVNKNAQHEFPSSTTLKNEGGFTCIHISYDAVKALAKTTGWFAYLHDCISFNGYNPLVWFISRRFVATVEFFVNQLVWVFVYFVVSALFCLVYRILPDLPTFGLGVLNAIIICGTSVNPHAHFWIFGITSIINSGRIAVLIHKSSKEQVAVANVAPTASQHGRAPATSTLVINGQTYVTRDAPRLSPIQVELQRARQLKKQLKLQKIQQQNSKLARQLNPSAFSWLWNQCKAACRRSKKRKLEENESCTQGTRQSKRARVETGPSSRTGKRKYPEEEPQPRKRRHI